MLSRVTPIRRAGGTFVVGAIALCDVPRLRHCRDRGDRPHRHARHRGELLRPRRLDGHEHRAERPRREPRTLSGYVDHRLPTRDGAGNDRHDECRRRASAIGSHSCVSSTQRDVRSTRRRPPTSRARSSRAVSTPGEPRSAQPQRPPHPRRRRRSEHRVHLPDQLDPDHRNRKHGLVDQRGAGVQRVLAGGKLRHAGDGLDVRRQHPGAHLDHGEQQRDRARPGPCPQRRGDPRHRHLRQPDVRDYPHDHDHHDGRDCHLPGDRSSGARLAGAGSPGTRRPGCPGPASGPSRHPGCRPTASGGAVAAGPGSLARRRMLVGGLLEVGGRPDSSRSQSSPPRIPATRVERRVADDLGAAAPARGFGVRAADRASAVHAGSCQPGPSSSPPSPLASASTLARPVPGRGPGPGPARPIRASDCAAGLCRYPSRLDLPSLGIAASMLGVGILPNDTMDAPEGPRDSPVWHQAFWYRGSAVPGAPSTALIAGHIDGPAGTIRRLRRPRRAAGSATRSASTTPAPVSTSDFSSPSHGPTPLAETTARRPCSPGSTAPDLSPARSPSRRPTASPT